jgi:large subunit ribosomal protein L7A
MSNEKAPRKGQFRVGTKQTLKALEQDKAIEVFVARDADPRVVTRVIQMCKLKGIKVTYVDTMAALGKSCGIEVGAATAALYEAE